MCLYIFRYMCGEDVCVCVCFVYIDSTCVLNIFKVFIEECMRIFICLIVFVSCVDS